MSYFATVKITDVNGNIIELSDVTPTLLAILEELKAIRHILEEDTGIETNKEE